MRLRGSLAAGGYITKSRRKCTQCGCRRVPPRMIEIISPAGFENFSELVAAGPPDIAQMGALAENHGLEFGEPPWLADIMSRYHLRPPHLNCPRLSFRTIYLFDTRTYPSAPRSGAGRLKLASGAGGAKPAADHPGRARPFREHGIRLYHDRRNRQRRRGRCRDDLGRIPQQAHRAASGLVRRFRSDEEDIRLWDRFEIRAVVAEPPAGDYKLSGTVLYRTAHA